MNETSPPPPRRSFLARLNFRRIRLYAWAVLVVLALFLLAATVLVRAQPQRVAENVLSQLPFSSSVGSVEWITGRTVRIKNLRLGDFFYADSITIKLRFQDLLRRRLSGIQVDGGQLFTRQLFAQMSKEGNGGGGISWSIGKLEIRRGTIMLDDLVAATAIPVRLGVRQPIILQGLKLGPPDGSPGMTAERVVDIENVNIVSPFDPLAPVLAFPLTRVTFTYRELWHHNIRRIQLIRPVIYLGQDLFWFSDQLRKDRDAAPAAAQGLSAPWSVHQFSVRYGQLAINVFGQPKFQFPFFFETDVNDIRLDQLDKISAKSTIAIEKLTADYPAYKLRVKDLEGKLEFSIPPSDAQANNVVPTIHIAELAWNDIAATDVWSSVTFDPTGVYGRLGGKCEGGYLKGNFEVYYTKGFTWNADFFADKINCQPIAKKLAGSYFDLSGELDGKLAVQGRAAEILRCTGALSLPQAGQLRITSLDDLLNRLPADTPKLKRDAIKLAIDSLRTYPYTSGEFKIDYQPAQGLGTLRLDSPLGKRQFDIYWHPL
jgi:hypothetical protein